MPKIIKMKANKSYYRLEIKYATTGWTLEKQTFKSLKAAIRALKEERKNEDPAFPSDTRIVELRVLDE